MQRKTIQFAVRSDSPRGGPLKLRHYFEHVLASELGTRAAAYLPEDTPWTTANPWTAHRSRVTHSISWSEVAIMVVSGLGWDRFIPAQHHDAPPFRVVYLLQSFQRLDPRDSQFRHLANPAVRICVSRPLQRALRALDVANGAIHTIPAGIDLGDLPSDSTRDTEILILGLKRPKLATSLRDLAQQAGLRPTLLTNELPRTAFLEKLSRAQIVVCLPDSQEGFYLPALESMAVGALTVCPDVGGNDYCIDGVNCFKPVYRLRALLDGLKEAARMPVGQAEAMLHHARATAARHDLRHERTHFQALLREIERTSSSSPPFGQDADARGNTTHPIPGSSRHP